jgi:hypothetical protein
MDTEAQRLELLWALGGGTVAAQNGSMVGVLDNEFAEAADTETTVPVMSCTTLDVKRLEIRKGSKVTYAGTVYAVRRHEPDGSGMSRLLLETIK